MSYYAEVSCHNLGTLSDEVLDSLMDALNAQSEAEDGDIGVVGDRVDFCFFVHADDAQDAATKTLAVVNAVLQQSPEPQARRVRVPRRPTKLRRVLTSA